MQTTAKVFGRLLVTTRKERRLTQKELGRRAHLHQTYIGHLENATSCPSLDVFLCLCRAMDVDPAAFITRLVREQEKQ